jgi:hypothetical protein
MENIPPSCVLSKGEGMCGQRTPSSRNLRKEGVGGDVLTEETPPLSCISSEEGE